MLKSSLLFVFFVGCFYSFSTLADKLSISASQALVMAEEGELILVDIRSEGEWFQTGVAPMASMLSMHQQGGADAFSHSLLMLLNGNKSSPIALICASGVRSARMQAYLQNKGFTQVYNVSEGMLGTFSNPGWIAQGLPLKYYKKQ